MALVLYIYKTMKHIIFILAIVCFFGCKDNNPKPSKRISIITYSDSSYIASVQQHSYQPIDNKFSKVSYYEQGINLKVSMSGNNLNKTIKILVDNDTIINQISNTNPHTINVTIP
jgi:hypothetical protein